MAYRSISDGEYRDWAGPSVDDDQAEPDCKRCRNTGHVYEYAEFLGATTDDLLSAPCPDCQPEERAAWEQTGNGPWPR